MRVAHACGHKAHAKRELLRACGRGGWLGAPADSTLDLDPLPDKQEHRGAHSLHEQLVGDENVKWHLCTAPRGGTGEPTGVGWGPRAGENLGSEC